MFRTATHDPTGVLTIDALDGARVHSGGIDLVDVTRLAMAVRRCGPPVLHRLFGADERAACAEGSDPAMTAELFGIKESVAKVVGGLPRGSSYRDVSLGVGADGPVLPVRLRGELARWADDNRVEVIGGSVPRGPDLYLSWALALVRDDETPC